MINNIFLVFQQVAILFIIILVGFVLGKKNMFSETAAKILSNLVLTVATPCAIIISFQRKFKPDMLIGLAITVLSATLIYIFSIIICKIIFKDTLTDEKKILHFATVFSNCGFMALPLLKAVLGDDGVFYGAGFLVAFNLFFWTWGVKIMGGAEHKLAIKAVMVSPGILGVLLGVLLFVFKITLPEILSTPVTHLGNLNTPLPMIIIGYYLSKANLKQAFTSASAYISMILRLIIIPLISLVIMRLCGVSGVVLVSVIIAASTPVAAGTTMLAAKYNRDIELSVSLVSATTVLSVITMPLIIGFAQFIA